MLKKKTCHYLKCKCSLKGTKLIGTNDVKHNPPVDDTLQGSMMYDRDHRSRCTSEHSPSDLQSIFPPSKTLEEMKRTCGGE